jgi:hypothetical protein
MGALFAVFQLPIMLLNAFGVIVSGAWLLAIGEWRPVIIGVITAIFAPMLLRLALLPGTLFAASGAYFAQKGVTIGIYFIGLLSSIYIYVLIAAWCGGIIFYFMQNPAPGAFWPLLIWSYGIATSPWSYLAQREGVAALLAAFFAQAGFIVLMVAVALGADLNDAFQVFALVLIVGVFFHMRTLAQAYRAGLFETK